MMKSRFAVLWVTVLAFSGALRNPTPMVFAQASAVRGVTLIAADLARQGDTFAAVVLDDMPKGKVPLQEGDEGVFNRKLVETPKADRSVS